MTPKGQVRPWWHRCLIVLGKEMRDHLRDHRSLGLALIYPLLGPLVVGLLLQVSADSMRAGGGDRPLTVAERGAAHAPALAGYLSGRKVTLIPAAEAGSPDPRASVVLEVPPEAAQGDHFTVRILFDANSAPGAGTASRLADLIAAYGRQVSQRLLADRGLDAAILQPVMIERVHTGRQVNVAQLFYNLIPPLVVFMVFLGSVYLALDTTVGERERGTLEPLLTAPVRRWELLAGKAAAAALFTVATLAVNLTAFRLVVGLASSSVPGLDGPPGTGAFLLMFSLALPVAVLAVTVQLAVGAVARSMKEAQIYLGLLPLVPALPGVAAAMSPVAPTVGTACVPVFGQMVLFSRLINGTGVSALEALLSAAITLAAALVVFYWAILLYERERNLLPD